MQTLKPRKIAVVGASHAAVSFATNLRQMKWEGEITLFNRENEFPYHRPPLSKDYLTGAKQTSQLRLKSENFYKDNAINLEVNAQVTEISDRKLSFTTNSEESREFGFDALVFATGASPRKLLDTADHPRICYIRTIEDINAVKNELNGEKNVVIIGGGYIGLEVAASLCSLNHKVTLLEALPRLLARVACEPISDYFAALHRAKGVDILNGMSIEKIRHEQDISSVLLSNGNWLKADLIVVGIGVVPNSELAESIGVDTDNGIRVDDRLQTNKDNIFAIGDCTSFYHPQYHKYVRLESVPNCNDQARRLASFLCEKPLSSPEQPWFWSDQYDKKLQIAGLSVDYDDIVVKGSTSNHEFAVGYLKRGQLRAIDCLNMPKVFVWGKKNLFALPPAQNLLDL